ncbi:MAG: hypothetical protein JWO38_6738 [Gemmataceae bacterium]|nr:hypothetical protein [Gemmataceae bacterium]
MTAKLRLPAGGTALLAGFCFLAAATAAPDLPKDSTKKAVAADTAALKDKIDDIAADPAKGRGKARTAKALALTLAVYGDDATKGQAAKVLIALDKKDYKGAADAAKGLASPAADPAALKGLDGKFDLEDVMSPFRPARSGGLNIEKDIKDGTKGAGKLDPKDAELIGARTAALAEYTLKLPNDKAKTNDKTTTNWERWAKDMGATSKDLTDEAAKGDKADQKKLLILLKKLDASCSNCHNDFRD